MNRSEARLARRRSPGYREVPSGLKVSESAIENRSIFTGEPIFLSVLLENASIEEVQRKLARIVLEHVRGNKSKAASILKVSRPRLDRILKTRNRTG
jgi:DNA-binding NtrC family response regulator